MKPIKNSIPIRELQTLLRQWRRKGLKEAALLKVLELYLGLPNYMNEQGVYPVHFFYDLAISLKFRTVKMMLEAVQLSEAGKLILIEETTLSERSIESGRALTL